MRTAIIIAGALIAYSIRPEMFSNLDEPSVVFLLILIIIFIVAPDMMDFIEGKHNG